ncbi:GIY-YIG nuclease family protein [Mycolicibacterium fortuitum]|uniref:GIY-YIG nuclease family protein n=1 Tax=Mycolicibacterium fortuitum TaxID=1766 RepID=A0AAE5AA15_MYCFO|nr:GIY-YIG nuclease family protein [Mycolicibacterium fortuitum]MDV7194650.1 GIY-YIG nuclease family protein [Mycolicibacterium fortuitum]MDV7208649.1 GIY-YIG nuclease family protein [Mycolicibacterium fortuitum]MDV7230546.1 GIY-YIG nuclease family protein [Mycolicibacterium fortuitum]MDV7261847.1 GIY-YIG nuclease family protein [Mycolicibacterium fortuitum]MDV7287043.1 GIY-YIG nuclease family protein [Mycolicibacterium fortuitum]
MKQNILYRAYDENCTLLYIGITANPGVRLRKHAEGKDWWGQVTSIQLQHFKTRDALEEAEREAIAAESPVFNTQHNPNRREAFLAYYDDGDPEDEDFGGGEYVLESYDSPELEVTPEEREGMRAAARYMDRLLSEVAS